MSATGRGSIRHHLDHYESPLWATQAIIPHLGMPHRVLDLGCGGGGIGHALRLAWGERTEIIGVDADPERVREADRAKTAADAFVYDRADELDVLGPLARVEGADDDIGEDFDLVISNPPYSHAREFVDAARTFLRPGGRIAMLLRAGFAASVERCAWHQANPSDMHVLSRRPGFYPLARNKTDSAEYAWFLWGHGHGGRWSVLECEPSKRKGAP